MKLEAVGQNKTPGYPDDDHFEGYKFVPSRAECALIASLIGTVAIASLTATGGQVNNLLASPIYNSIEYQHRKEKRLPPKFVPWQQKENLPPRAAGTWKGLERPIEEERDVEQLD